MHHPFRTLSLAAWLLCVLLGATARAGFVTNGGFEDPAVVGRFQTFSSGETLSGWQVGPGGVDVVHQAWQAAAGTQSVDLSATDAGSISQLLALTPGQTYDLAFWLAGNPQGGPALREMEVFWAGGSLGVFAFDATGRTPTAMGWQAHRLTGLSAPAGAVELRFTSLTRSAFGPTLDGVSVVASAVPEPPGSALLGLGSVLAWLGLGRRPRAVG
ncbi:hypothetical protein Pla175_27070 [Pirellulimonas nuda]|uniref:DUF642 domain-containing protein n=1 Tax=Pirellulimonas nuda TaxID=2528009 RepID=A0A518DCV7_9BACT|nr:choice-of-anchor C family protein [Pirellulimonas nuda]QDU89318.1 hypothetical protein Pla175_27070 [Pirellulimonas nuda]